MKKKSLALTAVAALTTLSLALAGCGSSATGLGGANASNGSSTQAAATKGGTLTVLTAGTSINLDPASSQNLATTTGGMIHRRLNEWKVSKNGDAQLVPDLATNTGKPSDVLNAFCNGNWNQTNEDFVCHEILKGGSHRMKIRELLSLVASYGNHQLTSCRNSLIF